MTAQNPTDAKPVESIDAREPWVAPEIASFLPAKAAENVLGSSGFDGLLNNS